MNRRGVMSGGDKEGPAGPRLEEAEEQRCAEVTHEG